MLRMLGITDADLEGKQVYRGVGCQRCGDMGYRGRQGIFEMLEMNNEIRELAFVRAATGKIRRAARASGMRTLLEDGKLKILRGTTSPEEVVRITQEEVPAMVEEEA
jgi:type II secretory ATPase GspE/PulE/Tfp pilus assembly ATPase PilB-like protein